MDKVSIPKTDYPPGWYVVVVQDQFHTWDWQRNMYRYWCQEHCVKDFSVTKIHREKVMAKFESESDAFHFILRWM